MNRLSIFQIVVIAIFVIFIVSGFVALYLTRDSGGGGGSGGGIVELNLWGTISSAKVNGLMQTLKVGEKGYKINYREISKSGFDQIVLEALATGRGPDAFILPHNELIKYQDKIFIIPYESYNISNLKTEYVNAGEIVKSKSGILGIPFGLDPLIMYWNRDYFASNGLSNPPRYWDEFFTLAKDLTQKSADGLQIKRSAVSIGNFDNVDNAKEILSAMLIQSGEYPLAQLDNGQIYLPARKAMSNVIDFYASFSDPRKPNFTWSKNLNNSLDLFALGDLGMYFGFVSDDDLIRAKNPNLDYSVSYFPQPRDAKVNITFGNVLTVAVSKWSSKANSAISFAYLLGSTEGSKMWSYVSKTPPIRRDLLGSRPTDILGIIAFDSALWARNWPDPNPIVTNDILGTIIDSVSSGLTKTFDAIKRADSRLGAFVK